MSNKAKIRRRRKAKGSRRETLVVSSIDMATGEASYMEFDGDPRDYSTYLQAHELIEHEGSYGALPSRARLAEAMAILEAGTPLRHQRLWAMVLLGHAPCAEALEALEAYARSGRPDAGVAQAAALECADLIGRAARATPFGLAWSA